MIIKPINTVVIAEDFAKMLKWYLDTFEFTTETYPGMEDSYVGLLSNGVHVIGLTACSEENKPPTPRNNATFMQVSCSHIFTLFSRIESNGGEVLFGPARDEGYWYGGVKDIEGNQIWVFTPDADLVEDVPKK
ncbi:MAG: hypothetical protein JXR56_01595 [Candidatus Cloacimonetes bacterium]|nr:hypothetical protein [Candidatus Cloacimonadota bacterium]